MQFSMEKKKLEQKKYFLNVTYTMTFALKSK